jgi:hypothetical protein
MHGIDEFRLHLDSDPNVAVVEMTIRATATETGRPYNQQLVLIAVTLNSLCGRAVASAIDRV